MAQQLLLLFSHQTDAFSLCMCAVIIMGAKHFDDSMHVHKQRLRKAIHVQMFTHRKKNR